MFLSGRRHHRGDRRTPSRNSSRIVAGAKHRAGANTRVAILDDVHHAYEATNGVRRLRDRAEVKMFTGPVGAPSELRELDALIANRERTRFTRSLLQELPDLRIIAQTGNHAYHVDLAA